MPFGQEGFRIVSNPQHGPLMFTRTGAVPQDARFLPPGGRQNANLGVNWYHRPTRTVKLRIAVLNMTILPRRTPLLPLQAWVIVKPSTRISSTWADLQAMPGQDQPRKQHQVGNNAVM